MAHSFPVPSPFARRCGGVRRRAGAFTLLEVLLAVAIIGLIGAVLIGGSARLLSEEPVTPQEVFWKAIQEARKAAIKAEHEMRLKYDKEKKQFVVVDGLAPARVGEDGMLKDEVPVKVLPVPASSTPSQGDDFTVDFLAAGKGGNMVMIAGVVVETQPITYVTFYPDGTCAAFRAQFFRNGAASIINIDPWTCAPVLTPTDPNAPPS